MFSLRGGATEVNIWFCAIFCTCVLFKKKNLKPYSIKIYRVSVISKSVKNLAAEPDSLSSILGTHKEVENCLKSF